ncbi:LLM class flavin-dependent oxidoreductase [uncultured Agrococcus sp.]|uniref:LLM class flavin-dependent oxidoreductase n=1 Tax=uncultured Agrococcus sp. TaxID=382258 RepID=UPI0025F45C94|nr:LLM class flavin-dependent oxidoreductase [uncultured Agrococcus sp.]
MSEQQQDRAGIALGLDSFGDMTSQSDGSRTHSAQVIRDHVGHAVLADSFGIDAISFGEHHRRDFAISAPDMVLAGAATVTERITLGTAVTVLSSDDPIRVMERFATLDAMANGRAEITVGRGSFTESFPLFGYELNDYALLFEEKFDMFARLLDQPETFTWSGQHRKPVEGGIIMPRTETRLAAWVGVGGSPESVLRSVKQRIPMMLAIIGGPAARFKPYADLYRRAQSETGVPRMPLGVHSPGHIAETDEKAHEELRDRWIANRNTIGRERGWPPSTADEFEHEAEHGSLYVGSPETVAKKIAQTVLALDLDRFDLKYSNGPMQDEQLRRSIELYGTEVIPRVREIVGEARQLN